MLLLAGKAITMVPPDCGVDELVVVDGLVELPHPANAKLEASSKPEARAILLRFKLSPPYFYAMLCILRRQPRNIFRHGK